MTFPGLLLAAAGFSGGTIMNAMDVPLFDLTAGYVGWNVEGEAFKHGPVGGKRLGELQIVNAATETVICSEVEGDVPQGTITSPEFKVERDFIAFRIGGGDYERHCCFELWVEGKVVRSATGRNSDRLMPQSWDVREFRGRVGRVKVVDRAGGDWGHINVDGLVQTDVPEGRPASADELYEERFRPQFHFTARQWTMNRLNPGMRQEGWINDLNGLIFYEGEFHLFAQRWHKCWLHAVSPDLIHWRELEPAFWAEELDEGVQSGTCVVDYGNTSGLSPDSKNPAMVAFWSDVHNESQRIHYSLDRGRTWTLYPGNPVLAAPERDPKVFWYEPGKHWVMILYAHGKYQFFTSSNLLQWKDEKSLVDDGFECPDFFELPVDGDKAKKKWVLVHGDGRYSVGRFDGRAFSEESPRRLGDIGPNFYATQSWENTGDGRRIQAAWMRGSDFPDMPFSQQISFPCELSLRTTSDGLRLFRNPVKEIEALQGRRKKWSDRILKAGEKLNLDAGGELYRMRAKVKVGAEGQLNFWVRGACVTLRPDGITSGAASAKSLGEVRRVDVLIDRASIEVFVNEGEISSTRYALLAGRGLAFEAVGADSTLEEVEVIELKSSWPSKEKGSGAEPSKMSP